jgi:hypothetical protein
VGCGGGRWVGGGVGRWVGGRVRKEGKKEWVGRWVWVSGWVGIICQSKVGQRKWILWVACCKS